MFLPLLVPLLLALATPTPTPLKAPEVTKPYRHPGTGLVFPAALGGLERGEVVDYERQAPGLGVCVS